MKAKKVTYAYAEVNCVYGLFRVWPNGTVEEWCVDDYNINGYWNDEPWAKIEEPIKEEIKRAGLEVLKDE